jgi:electron transfer flavoprotein alpha subunit
VVAINKDRAAPIFQQADLGVLGDALRVVPALVERLQERRSTA